MREELINKDAANDVLNALFPAQIVSVIEKLYELVNTAEMRGYDEGRVRGSTEAFTDGWHEGYEIGYCAAEENIYSLPSYDDAELAFYDDCSTYEDVDVAAAALGLDETLMLAAYEGDSGDEG
jgi:hypothetical protein